MALRAVVAEASVVPVHDQLQQKRQQDLRRPRRRRRSAAVKITTTTMATMKRWMTTKRTR